MQCGGWGVGSGGTFNYIEDSKDHHNASHQGQLLPTTSFFFPLLFLPKSPQYIVVYFSCDPSSCGMWDAASAWLDEQCPVHTQDPNR